jgi:uncharacterized protein
MQEGQAGSIAPTSAQERIEVLDVVRGFALIGILLMNIEWFSRPVAELAFALDPDLQGVHYAVGWTIMAFVQGKFYTMFSLLFGMGFVVFLERAYQGGRGAGLFARRLLVLFVIGVAHGCLLWSGDILATYAVLGLPLLAWRRATPRKLLTSAAILFMLPLGLMALMALGMAMQKQAEQQAAKDKPVATAVAAAPAATAPATPDAAPAAAKPAEGEVKPAADEAKPEDPVAEMRKEAAEAEKIYSSGSWVEITAQRSREFLRQFAFILFGGPNILALFLVGAWFVRSGLVRDIDAHAHVFRRMAIFGLGLGAPLALFAMPRVAHANMFELDLAGTIGQSAMYFANVLLCLGYVGTIVLLWQRARDAAWVHALSATGRMALTNYLTHSLVLSTLFFAYGFGLWGQVPRAAQALLALALYGAQILFSRWWLTRYRYGPMEWLWRCGTYLQVQPLRR